MIKIRLARGGVKKKPFYKVVAIDARQKRGGRPVEVLGYWNPSKDEIKINKKKVEEWVGKGAQISKAVKDLLK